MKKIVFIITIAAAAIIGSCRSSIVDDPSTNIQYSITRQSYVKLTVENSYNTVVATPVDGIMAAGTHSVNVNMDNLLEGVYFYILEYTEVSTGLHYKSEKMFLLAK
jgi:hypothetical protein